MKIVPAILVVLAISACATEASDEQPSAPPPTSAEAQGITQERAEELWATVTGEEMAPIVHAHRCEPGICFIQVKHAAWASVPFDSKEDFVAGAGKAAAVLHGADYTEIRDANSNEKYATYSARMKSVRMP